MSKKDPTNQARNRKKAARELRRRLSRAQSEILPLIDGLSFERTRQAVVVNRSEVFYDYLLTPFQEDQLASQISLILESNLTPPSEQPPENTYWYDEIEPPYREGALSSFTLLEAGLVAAILAGDLPQTTFAPDAMTLVRFDDELRAGLYRESFSGWRTIKGMSERTSAQVYQVIRDGLEAGLSPIEIKRNIRGRFDVAKSSANRIADTEINRVYNNARIGAARVFERETGVQSLVIHQSALIATTRPHHAARHGNLYTPEQQNRWWDSGANRVNCHCGVIPVLAKDGKALNDNQITILKEQKDFFKKN